jgi:hypothetical protein
VSCLNCGWIRRTHRSERGHLQARDCPQCSYVGWIDVDETEALQAVERPMLLCSSP